MEIYFSQQALAFLWAVVLGGGLGALYDLFRIGRILKKKWAFTVFCEDLLFSLLAALATAWSFTFTNYGQVRLFLLVGEGLGFMIYHYTVGAFVTFWARLFKGFLTFLGQKIKKIMKFLKKPFIFLKKCYRITMYHFVERRSLGEKERRQNNSKKHQGQARQANESRGTGLFAGGSPLRRRQYAQRLHQAASADPGKAGRAVPGARTDLHANRHQRRAQ